MALENGNKPMILTQHPQKNYIKQKLASVALILTALMDRVLAQANFTLSQPILSGKTYFRPVSQGPEFEHFSVCTSATTCFITRRADQIWTNTALNEPFPYAHP